MGRKRASQEDGYDDDAEEAPGSGAGGAMVGGFQAAGAMMPGMFGGAPVMAPGAAMGFPPGSAPGFPPGAAMGFPPGAAPGFAPGMAPGFAPGAAPGFAQGSAPGFAQGTSPGFVPGMAPGMLPGMAFGGAGLPPGMAMDGFRKQAPAMGSNPMMAMVARGNPMFAMMMNGGMGAGTTAAPPPPKAAPKPAETLSPDPDIVELFDHFHIDPRHLSRFQGLMEKREVSFAGDMLKLWELLEHARSPEGMLVSKMREMETGTFIGKTVPDELLLEISRKYRLDQEAESKLSDILAKFDPERRAAYMKELERHLEVSSRPSAMVMMSLKKLGDGIPLGKPGPAAAGSYLDRQRRQQQRPRGRERSRSRGRRSPSRDKERRSRSRGRRSRSRERRRSADRDRDRD